MEQNDLFQKPNPLQRRLTDALKRLLTEEIAAPEYACRWKRQRMPSGLPIPAIRARARRISAKGCSGWPTPKTSDKGNVGPSQEDKSQSLPWAARLAGWPTTRSTDADKGIRTSEGAIAEFERKGTGADLPTVANLAGWATQCSADSKSHRNETATRHKIPPTGIHPGQTLTDQITGTTPYSSPAETEKRGALNPFFSLYLMGYPISWGIAGIVSFLKSKKR